MDYNADVYSRDYRPGESGSYGAGTFSDTLGSNRVKARILARVPVKDPNNKCVGANNGDAFCILNDEADSAGVLPCRRAVPAPVGMP